MLFRGIVCLAAAFLSAAAGAQSYPDRPVRIVVPFTPGGSPDTITRIVGAGLTNELGQPIVIENRAGAGSTIGTAMVAKAPPDGYTLVATTAMTFSAATFANLTYDPIADFAGVAQLALSPGALVIAAEKNVRTLGELIALAKAKPGVLNYASAGPGSFSHVFTAQLLGAANAEMTHVPVRGAAEALTEVMTGRIDIVYSPLTTVLSSLRGGKMVALGMGSSRRSALLPSVPTTVEAGVPGSSFDAGVGLWAPKKTPREVIQRLHGAIRKVVESEALKAKLESVGAESWPMSSEEMDAHTASELAELRKLVARLGIKPQ
ncbi:MAG: tripartite tricarboxylate transporter substrate binding protein [Betaproteobacteria bacterium]|nr:tripartite tricarboxylate transporter substrate binding protein [Betaproteobacteria bacterium]